MTLEIMMPFYGSFDHLRVAVASVLAQTDGDWRLTVVDDVYPDTAPGEWVQAIDDERVSYLRNETNLKPSRNYNKCVGLAREEFVVLMGCDDVMHPGYVAKVHDLIRQHPNADILQPGVNVIDENGATVTPLADRVKGWYRFGGHGVRAFDGERLATSLLRADWAYFPSLVWRTSRLAQFGFRTDLDVVQDLAMLIDIALAGGTLVLDDEVVFSYRRHSASFSSITGPDGSKFAQERQFFAEAAAACDAKGWSRAARAARAHFSSRLHALAEIPKTFGTGTSAGRKALIAHVTGR